MGNFLSKDKFKIIGSQFRWNISELAQADARVDLLIHLSSILEKVSNEEVLEISYKTSSAKALIINQAVQAILRVLLIYDTGGTEAGVTPSSSSATLLPSLFSISRPFLSLSSLPYLFPCPFFPAPPSPLLFPPPCPLVQLRGLKRIVRSPSGVPAANTFLTILTPENMSADNTLSNICHLQSSEVIWLYTLWYHIIIFDSFCWSLSFPRAVSILTFCACIIRCLKSEME